MKLSRFEQKELARRLAVARGRNLLTDVEIGNAAGVHPSQVGRICRGDFRTLSHNVVQICNALQIPHQNLGSAGRSAANEVPDGWPLIETAVNKAWDRTPGGAERLAHAIEAIAALSPRPRRPRNSHIGSS